MQYVQATISKDPPAPPSEGPKWFAAWIEDNDGFYPACPTNVDHKYR